MPFRWGPHVLGGAGELLPGGSPLRVTSFFATNQSAVVWLGESVPLARPPARLLCTGVGSGGSRRSGLGLPQKQKVLGRDHTWFSGCGWVSTDALIRPLGLGHPSLPHPARPTPATSVLSWPLHLSQSGPAPGCSRADVLATLRAAS